MNACTLEIFSELTDSELDHVCGGNGRRRGHGHGHGHGGNVGNGAKQENELDLRGNFRNATITVVNQIAGDDATVVVI